MKHRLSGVDTLRIHAALLHAVEQYTVAGNERAAIHARDLAAFFADGEVMDVGEPEPKGEGILIPFTRPQAQEFVRLLDVGVNSYLPVGGMREKALGYAALLRSKFLKVWPDFTTA